LLYDPFVWSPPPRSLDQAILLPEPPPSPPSRWRALLSGKTPPPQHFFVRLTSFIFFLFLIPDPVFIAPPIRTFLKIFFSTKKFHPGEGFPFFFLFIRPLPLFPPPWAFPFHDPFSPTWGSIYGLTRLARSSSLENGGEFLFFLRIFSHWESSSSKLSTFRKTRVSTELILFPLLTLLRALLFPRIRSSSFDKSFFFFFSLSPLPPTRSSGSSPLPRQSRRRRSL